PPAGGFLFSYRLASRVQDEFWAAEVRGGMNNVRKPSIKNEILPIMCVPLRILARMTEIRTSSALTLVAAVIDHDPLQRIRLIQVYYDSHGFIRCPYTSVSCVIHTSPTSLIRRITPPRVDTHTRWHAIDVEHKNAIQTEGPISVGLVIVVTNYRKHTVRERPLRITARVISGLKNTD